MNSGQSSFDGRPGITRTTHYQRSSANERDTAWLRQLFSAISFWSAIALPAIYLPLLADGIETPDRLWLFLGLFGLHVLALVGGRRRHVESG